MEAVQVPLVAPPVSATAAPSITAVGPMEELLRLLCPDLPHSRVRRVGCPTHHQFHGPLAVQTAWRVCFVFTVRTGSWKRAAHWTRSIRHCPVVHRVVHGIAFGHGHACVTARSPPCCCKGHPGTLRGEFFLIRRSHSISFTRAQGIPKYKIGLGGGKDGRVGEIMKIQQGRRRLTYRRHCPAQGPCALLFSLCEHHVVCTCMVWSAAADAEVSCGPESPPHSVRGSVCFASVPGSARGPAPAGLFPVSCPRLRAGH